MSLRVYVLRGGMWGWDGIATSPGMDTLARQIAAVRGVTVSVHNWSDYYGIAAGIYTGLPPATRIAFVGYSGGGWKAAQLCAMVKRPIELIVVLDPSPASWMEVSPIGPNVKKAICYFNEGAGTLASLGYGGGVLRGKNVITRKINENHLSVQFDESVRAGTVAAIRETNGVVP